MNIVRLETQANFPSTDISDENAAILELLLLNREVLSSSHKSAELASYLYRLGHTTLNAIASPHFDDNDRITAFSYGIATYEAIAAMVRPNLGAQNEASATLQIMSAGSALSHKFVATIAEVRDKFYEELPRTQHIIGESASRFYHDYQDYAISGAAIARELEINTTAA